MSILRVNTIEDKDGNDSAAVSGIEPGMCKAWIRFNGEGTISITDDFNVSTISDNNTGDYTITFDTSFSDGDYVFVGQQDDNYGSGTSCPHIMPQGTQGSTQTSSSCRIYSKDSDNGASDAPRVTVVFIGQQ